MAPLTDPDRRFWRTDVQLGRSIYALVSNNVESPSDSDPLIGVMETSELAEIVVDTHNGALSKYGHRFLKVLTTDD